MIDGNVFAREAASPYTPLLLHDFSSWPALARVALARMTPEERAALRGELGVLAGGAYEEVLALLPGLSSREAADLFFQVGNLVRGEQIAAYDAELDAPPEGAGAAEGVTP